MSDPNAIDPKFFNRVAQFAHVGMMFLVTTVCADLSYKLGHRLIGVVVGVAGCTLYATWHEFIWDPEMENPLTRGSDAEDFCFLITGALSAAVVYRFLVL
jgi:hypothetical protein